MYNSYIDSWTIGIKDGKFVVIPVMKSFVNISKDYPCHVYRTDTINTTSKLTGAAILLLDSLKYNLDQHGDRMIRVCGSWRISNHHVVADSELACLEALDFVKTMEKLL